MRKKIKKTIEEEIIICDICGKEMNEPSFSVVGRELFEGEYPDVHESCVIKFCREALKDKLKS